jgi:hypothetical protein
MASRTRTAWEERSPVASELEAIFAPLPRLAPAPADLGVPRAAPARGTRAAPARGSGVRLWLALLGVVALAALVGSLAFLMPIAQQPSPPRIVTHAASIPAPKLPLPQPKEAIVEAQPPEAVPETPQFGPAIRPAPSPSRAAPGHRAILAPARHGRCPRFATEAWCLHGTIMAADDELRGAYRAAVRAGVDRDLLVDVRSDWKRLRGRANHDPQALIRGYALLTQELRAETRRARR